MNSVQQKELDLYNYYRLIRNSFVHQLPFKSLSSVSVDVSYFQTEFPQLEAPNEPNLLKFDDFILFTALVKRIAFQITQSVESNICWCSFLQANKSKFPKLGKLKGRRVIIYIYKIA